MKCLVTGAAGFIPSHLYESLKKEGHQVKGIDNFSHACGRPMPDIKYADIRYYQDIDKLVEWADIVFHLAAQNHVDKSIEHVEETLDTNIKGTYNILEACRVHGGKKMVFASTSEVYGTNTDKLSENSPTSAQSPYAVSKLAGDKLCGNYHDLYGVKVWRLRNFNVYGEWQNNGSYGSVIPIFVKQALEGKQLTIFGTGEQRRDYMYIDDAIQAYKLITDIPQLEGDVVNAGFGTSVSINDLGKLICKIVNVPFNPVYLPARAGEVMKLEADTTLFESYGFKPTIDIEKGLTQYIEWYKQYGYIQNNTRTN